MEQEFLSYKEAALFLALPIGTLYSLVSQKRIPHKRFGNRLVRFSKKELNDWIQLSSVELKNNFMIPPTNEEPQQQGLKRK